VGDVGFNGVRSSLRFGLSPFVTFVCFCKEFPLSPFPDVEQEATKVTKNEGKTATIYPPLYPPGSVSSVYNRINIGDSCGWIRVLIRVKLPAIRAKSRYWDEKPVRSARNILSGRTADVLLPSLKSARNEENPRIWKIKFNRAKPPTESLSPAWATMARFRAEPLRGPAGGRELRGNGPISLSRTPRVGRASELKSQDGRMSGSHEATKARRDACSP